VIRAADAAAGPKEAEIMNLHVRIGTRGSALALRQAEIVSDLLRKRDCITEVVVIKTAGDRITSLPLHGFGGKGLFVKEIQEALLDCRIDVAVHSLKDYPVENPPELFLPCVPEREDPRDAFVLSPAMGGSSIPEKARIGTGSLRRKFQLLLLGPGWEIVPLRGNVDSRLRKVESGIFDFIVLASAGLKRLGYEDLISGHFSLGEVIPAVGQGAIAVETRKDSRDLNDLLAKLDDKKARMETETERKFLRDLQGSCTTPVGIHAEISGGRMRVSAFLSSLSGAKRIRDEVEGNASDHLDLAGELFERFLTLGARELLCEV